MTTIRYPDLQTQKKLCIRPAKNQEDLGKLIDDIFFEISRNGDAAIQKYNGLFDGNDAAIAPISPAETERNCALVPQDLQQAISLAKQNIETFHASQVEKPEIIETMPGVSCWRENRPIGRVGIYIPGGSAPLFSTVLMLGVPARIAGCSNIVLCTPGGKNGSICPEILFTANLLGITEIYAIGGIQAIGAMTIGTETIGKVDKIFGPGNQYVTAAKLAAFQRGVAIDLPAGPSEVLVIATKDCVPSFVSADLLSQAEHGPDSQVVLVSDDENTIASVIAEVEKQLQSLPRNEIARLALDQSFSVLLTDLDQCIGFSNLYAPEHLILACADAAALAKKVTSAGSVFLGNFSCESCGDYASGTNHTLPTNGFARSYSGVSVDSFVKKITFQEISADGLKQLGPAVELMAKAEKLDAHARAVSIRLKTIGNDV